MIRRSCDGGRGYFRASVKLIFYRVCCHFKLRLRPDYLLFFKVRVILDDPATKPFLASK